MTSTVAPRKQHVTALKKLSFVVMLSPTIKVVRVKRARGEQYVILFANRIPYEIQSPTIKDVGGNSGFRDICGFAWLRRREGLGWCGGDDCCACDPATALPPLVDPSGDDPAESCTV